VKEIIVAVITEDEEEIPIKEGAGRADFEVLTF